MDLIRCLAQKDELQESDAHRNSTRGGFGTHVIPVYPGVLHQCRRHEESASISMTHRLDSRYARGRFSEKWY